MAKHSNSTDNMVDVLQQIVELAVAHEVYKYEIKDKIYLS